MPYMWSLLQPVQGFAHVHSWEETVVEDKYGRHLAQLVEIKREPDGTMGVRIDGELMPWFTVDGYSVEVRRNNMPGVTVTIAAEHVIVDDKYYISKSPVSSKNAMPGKELEV